MNDEMRALDGLGQAELVKKGEVRAIELVDAAIERIESLQPQLNALAFTDFEAARAKAESAQGPFAGVPFLIKDLLAYPGMRCSMGSRIFADFVPSVGSPYTEAIDRSGLVCLGKTTTSEMGLLGSTESALLGVTNNPWRRGISATGSSGGSAVAVAASMVPLAHASDGGGSIRIPASANGMFGLKPSRGRCLSTGPSEGDLLDVLSEHCISFSVRDSAMLLSCTERAEGPYPRLGYVDSPSSRRLKIGIYRTTLMGEAPTPEVAASLQKTVSLLESLGHEVQETPPPEVDGPMVSRAFFTAAGASMSGLLEMTGAPIEALEPFTQALIRWYQALPSSALPQVLQGAADAGKRMNAFLERFDVALSPVQPIVVPALGHLSPELEREELIRRTETFAGYTPIHNMSGATAMSVPLGEFEGLPIGSHFAARPGAEATLIQLAYELERAAPWRRAPLEPR